ncbi:hypothetical protein P280DRAFT_208764 [Massarina eburnea CBS 473.64]|uniref:Serine/threonine-protein kinase ppk6 n=1 Tax=Massarina eburnea CBS 473.64 TaxID=1395130 RepID=A0A6A6RHY9_9PLEO|nr:hypothetical protein P280DRAFT_208764 [Massarina eburnea CBS 473.64]
MSADLFAEFSSAPSSNQQQPSGSGQARSQPAPSFSFFDDLTSTPAPAAATQPQQQTFGGPLSGQFRNNAPTASIDDNDDWGDFEGGSSSFAPPAPVKQDPFAFAAPRTSLSTQSPWATGTTQNDPFSFAAAPPPQSSTAGWTKAPVIKAKKSADPSVLFDAEDDFDDDDFGDFEGEIIAPPAKAAPVPVPAPATSAVADLLGDLNFSEPTPPPPQRREGNAPRKLPSEATKKAPAGNFGSMARSKKSPTSVPVPQPTQSEDSWDTFDDWEASIPTKASAKAPSKPKETKTIATTKAIATPPPILSPAFEEAHAGELPPTNVPPPAVLLTLFPPLFSDAQNKLFKPMAAQPLPMRNKLLSEGAVITYLEGYLMLASVAAHIIAGRKLRWKRDQHLSQGMRIGPASSRATSGMKLSSVDKSESMKEEREASDAVRAWKDQVGRLRHVVSAVNQIKAGTLGAVPDIQETMAVKVLKQGEGGVPAPQACMMCGLKRDERVGLADQGVQDSFGEWWMDQVNMHRGCRNFWNEHRDKLRSR